MKGEVVMMPCIIDITSFRIATSWTDDHDPVVVDIMFSSHENAFQAFNHLATLLGFPDTTVWQAGVAMRETNKRHTRSSYASK